MTQTNTVAPQTPRRPDVEPPRGGTSSILGGLRRVVLTVPVLPLTIIVFIVLTVVAPGFGTWPNMQNLLSSMSVLAIAAIGATLVFLVGGIDLSVGSVVALSSVVGAIVSKDSGSVGLGLLAALGVGLVVGLVNGICIGYLGLQPFVLTLGILLSARAVAYMAAAAAAGGGGTAASVGQLPPSAFAFGQSTLAAVPVVFWIALVLVVVFSIWLAKTLRGRRFFLVGSNERAATFNGMSVAATKCLAYSVAGTLAGLGGWVLMTRLGSGNATAGDALLLQVIAATVIGGTSMQGGFGGVWRTLVGVLLISGLTIALGLLGLASWTQNIILGCVVVFGSGAAAYLNRLGGRR